MKKLFLTAILALGCAGAMDGAKVTIVTAERNLSGFTRIVNDSPYDIHFYESDAWLVKVVARSTDAGYVHTILREGTLTVRVAEGHKFRGKPYVEAYWPRRSQAWFTGLGAGGFIAMTALRPAGGSEGSAGSGRGDARGGQRREPRPAEPRGGEHQRKCGEGHRQEDGDAQGNREGQLHRGGSQAQRRCERHGAERSGHGG